jgi:hypothetical protein
LSYAEESVPVGPEESAAARDATSLELTQVVIRITFPARSSVRAVRSTRDSTPRSRETRMRHPLLDAAIDGEPGAARGGPTRPRTRWRLVAVGVVLLIALYSLSNMKTPEESARPILAALEEHRRAYGRYPEKPGELIDRGLLRHLPGPRPDLQAYRDGDFSYFYDKDLDIFLLGYTEMHWFHTHHYGGAYVSHKKTWASGHDLYDLHDPLTFVLDNAGGRFQEDKLFIYLDLFVNKIVEFDKLSRRTLFAHNLHKSLGSGERLELEGRWAFRYTAADRQDTTYCFLSSDGGDRRDSYPRIIKILRADPRATPPRWDEVWKER